MREDFKKVLCEEPRHKGFGDYKSLNKKKGIKKQIQKEKGKDFDDWSFPKKESMFGKRGRGDKMFGEHLQPLVRFLRSSIGRKWDDVFSEIRSHCPNDNAVNAHIYQHLWGYVERHPVFIDDKIYGADEFNYKRERQLLVDRGRDNTFYIDKNGILQRAPRQKRYKRQTKNSQIFTNNGIIYAQKNGIWYKTALKPIGKPTPFVEERTNPYQDRVVKLNMWRYKPFTDVYLGIDENSNFTCLAYSRNEKVEKCKAVYGRAVYCWQLQQLNSREIKKLGLKE